MPKKKESIAQLIWPTNANSAQVKRYYKGTALVRNIVNTPACDMGPKKLITAAKKVADKYDASYTVIEGDTLQNEYPLLYAMGKGSTRELYLIDIWWKSKHTPLKVYH